MENLNIEEPIEVPTDALSPDALRSVLESFIVREGTDYGWTELSMQQKVENLRRRISNGSAFLIFDPKTESITFLTDSEWRRLKPRGGD